MNSNSIPRVVIDTNVWVSAIFWGGKPREVIEIWIGDKISLIVSTDLRRELYRTVAKKAKALKIFPEYAADWLEVVDKKAVLVRPKEKVEVCRDSKDNMLLEAAVAGDANYLVTGDDDLLALKDFRGAKIVSPAKFLTLLR